MSVVLGPGRLGKWLTRSYSAVNGGSSPKPFADIPSPKGSVPILGHYLRIKKGLNNESKLMFKEVDSPIFKLKLPGMSIVMTNDPMGCKDLHSAEGLHPSRSGEKNIQWIFNQRKEKTPMVFESGAKWRETRSQLGKQAIPANVYGYINGFNKATNRLLRNIKDLQDNDGCVEDVVELIMYWTLEVGAWFSFGAELDARFSHRSEALKLRQCLQEILDSLNELTYSLPFFKIFPTQAMKKVQNGFDTLHEFGEVYANRYMERIMAGVSKGEKQAGQSLLEQWLIEGKMSKKEAVKNAGVMFGAGLDTTVNAVAFMLYELSKYREVQDKMYNQIIPVLGEDGEPDMDSLQRIPYLMNLIKESQRMCSVVSYHSRRLPKDSLILGYTVPAGTVVLYNMSVASEDPAVYKEPNQFNPDRWSQDNISPYASVPFGIGPRSCWGRRFAEVEMKILLIKLSQNFIMESTYSKDDKLPLAFKSGIRRPAVPINIKFIARNNK